MFKKMVLYIYIVKLIDFIERMCKMEKFQIWMIVGVFLVVAIIAFVATASITGNAIRVISARDRIDSTGSLTLSSATGNIKLEGDITLTKRGYVNGTQFLTDNAGSLTIIPQSGITIIKGNLDVGGRLNVATLAGGNGTAYVCVGSNGAIYRSLIACR